jgi:methyl-accepting chemotaxis protein
MNLSNFKVGTRLAFAFGVVVLMSVASGGLALIKLSVIQANLEDVVMDNNVKIKLNNDMRTAVHVVSRVVRSIALLEDQAAKDGEMVKIAEARAEYDKAWETLNTYPASEIGKANRAAIKAGSDAARPVNNKVLVLAMENKPAEAIALLLKESGPATTKWQDALSANSAFQEANNEKEYAASVASYSQARNLLIGANVVTLTLAILLGWLISRSLIVQLGAEPGEAAALAHSVAEGDLSVRINLKAGDSTSLMAQLKAMQESLAKVVSGVRQNADSVATASAQIAQGNHDLSGRTEQQASALEETAASMEELGSTVKLNADNAKLANQLAQSASTVAILGGEVVAQVVDTMKGINDSSKKIADIISVIDGIAFQTNILALNAAVEAARAGEQGRGFAVVASEVRSLAGRSADAAKEIKSLISASVERVEHGTALVDKAGTTMTEVVSSIRRVTDIMGEISAASAEQSAGVSQVGEAVMQMDQVTQQNAALVEESAAAAGSLTQQAQQLVQAVAVFKLSHGVSA